MTSARTGTLSSSLTDKGNVTVVMDRSKEGIHQEVRVYAWRWNVQQTEKGSYIIHWVQALKRCEREGYITRNHRLRLQPKCAVPYQVYGLSKTHKEDKTLRPTRGTPNVVHIHINDVSSWNSRCKCDMAVLLWITVDKLKKGPPPPSLQTCNVLHPCMGTLLWDYDILVFMYVVWTV